jgi:hypothetical protein
MVQCAEGWHLTEEPSAASTAVAVSDVELEAEPEPATESIEPGDAVAGQPASRRVRSTRRLSGMPELPQRPVEGRTVGATFTAPSGVTYRPSMFVTLTLPSYGKVRPGRGVPVHPDRYDYRRAALDALHFPKLMDRWFQNLRRGAGYKVQFYGAIEAQLRLAPHFHTALRGAIPRGTIKAVTAGTYAALWWPQMDVPVYEHRTPVWDDELYRDPDTGYPLPTWDEALAAIDADPDAEPAHVVTFGKQVDAKGILGNSADSERAVRYLTKYLTKSIAGTHGDEAVSDPAYEAHVDRLHEQVRWLPCSERCANWLRYGVQPKDAGPGLVPGHCVSKAHDREHLGLGGRRVLVSRSWSGKTLTEHRADRRAVVEQVLQAAGIQPEGADRMAADMATDDGKPRFVWEEVPVNEADWAHAVMRAMLDRRRRREQYELAKRIVGGTDPPVDNRSATEPGKTTVAA